MPKQPQNLLSFTLAVMSATIAMVANAEPVTDSARISDRPTTSKDYSSYVNVNTNNRYSNSSSQYQLYVAPDGSYVSRTSVRVSYPGGVSNTDVQYVVPPDVAAKIQDYWQRVLNPNSAQQR